MWPRGASYGRWRVVRTNFRTPTSILFKKPLFALECTRGYSICGRRTLTRPQRFCWGLALSAPTRDPRYLLKRPGAKGRISPPPAWSPCVSWYQVFRLPSATTPMVAHLEGPEQQREMFAHACLFPGLFWWRPTARRRQQKPGSRGKVGGIRRSLSWPRRYFAAQGWCDIRVTTVYLSQVSPSTHFRV